MGDMLPPVVAVLMADIKQFRAGMAEARGEMATTTGGMQKFAKFGKVALVAVAAAAIAVGAHSVSMASKFDAAMELVHTQAGATQREVNGMSSAVLSLAGRTAQAPKELADGLYHIESAGFRGKTALDMLTASAKGATIGQANLESVTQAMIGVMAVGFKDVHGAGDAMAYLNTIVGIGDMRMEKLAQSIATGVLPTFKSAGLGLKDYGAALATLTDNVTPADEAATRLRMTVALLSSPSKAAIKSLNTIGISSVQLANDMRSGGLLKAVMDLKTHLDSTYPASHSFRLSLAQQKAALGDFKKSLNDAGIPLDRQKEALANYAKELDSTGSSAILAHQAVTHAFGGGRSSGAILTLIEETDRLKSKYVALGTESSRARAQDEAWKATQQQFAVKMKQLHETIAALEIRIGNKLIPVIIKVAGWFVKATQYVEKHKAVAAALAAVVSGLLVVAIAAAVTAIYMMGAALLTAEVAGAPVILIVMAVIAALALLGVAIYEIAKHWHTIWRDIKAAAGDAVGFIITLIRHWVDLMLNYFGMMIHAAAALFGWVPGVGKHLKQAAAAFDDFHRSVDRKLTDTANAAYGWGQQTGKKLTSGITAGVDSGDKQVWAHAYKTGSNAAAAAKLAAKGEPIGENLAAGIVSGIDKQSAKVWAKAYALGSNAANAAKLGTRAQSPSKITDYAGQMIAEGLVSGMSKKEQAARAKAYRLGQQTALHALLAAEQQLGKRERADQHLAKKGTLTQAAANADRRVAERLVARARQLEEATRGTRRHTQAVHELTRAHAELAAAMKLVHAAQNITAHRQASALAAARRRAAHEAPGRFEGPAPSTVGTLSSYRALESARGRMEAAGVLRAGQAHIRVPVVIDGRVLFEVVQEHALQTNYRNVSSGLSL